VRNPKRSGKRSYRNSKCPRWILDCPIFNPWACVTTTAQQASIDGGGNKHMPSWGVLESRLVTNKLCFAKSRPHDPTIGGACLISVDEPRTTSSNHRLSLYPAAPTTTEQRHAPRQLPNKEVYGPVVLQLWTATCTPPDTYQGVNDR
jgi:hypothetical protein